MIKDTYLASFIYMRLKKNFTIDDHGHFDFDIDDKTRKELIDDFGNNTDVGIVDFISAINFVNMRRKNN